MIVYLFLASSANGQSVPSAQRNALEALLVVLGANQKLVEDFVDQNAKSNCLQGVVCTVVANVRTISEMYAFDIVVYIFLDFFL